MPEVASVNTGAVRWPDPVSAGLTVRGMQIELHRCLNQPSGKTRGEPDAVRVARPVRRAVSGKRTGSNPGTAPRTDPTTAPC